MENMVIGIKISQKKIPENEVPWDKSREKNPDSRKEKPLKK